MAFILNLAFGLDGAPGTWPRPVANQLRREYIALMPPDCHKVVLVQLPIPPVGPEPIRGNVPLAAGYLKLFARQRGMEKYFDIEILPADDANRMGDQALVEEIVS